MFSLERSGTMKCDYCGFVASSAHELLTRHICYRSLHARNAAQQSSRIYRPSAIKKSETQALRSLRLPSARQNNVKNSISKDIRNDSRGKKKFIMNPSKAYYGFRPPVASSYSPQSILSSPRNEILDESEVHLPVLEYKREHKFLNERNNSSKNNANFIPSPVTVHRRFPSNSSLERVTSSRPLHQLLEESQNPTTAHRIERRIFPVNSNHASSNQLISSFYDTKPLSVDTVIESELVSESSSEPMHVMLVSPINKEITIVSLDNVMNEIEKRMERLPYKIKLQLEYEFLKKLQDSVDDERRIVINAV